MRGARSSLLRRWSLAATLATLATVARGGRLGAQEIADGHEAFRTGKYPEAITILSKVPASSSDWIQAQGELARVYATIGKYDEAENVARRAAAAKGGSGMWNTLGETLLLRGKRAAAESAFVRAGAEHAPDSLTAALNLAVLHYDRGEHDRAMKEFDHFIDVYNAGAGSGLTSEELTDVAKAVEYLGANDPQLFKDALKAYDRAVTADPTNADARVKLGELFLSKYNFAEAQTTFEEVLQTNPSNPRALLGAARRLELDGHAGGDSLLRAALTINPDYVQARVLHGQMLMSLEDYAAAQQDIDRALAVNPGSLDGAWRSRHPSSSSRMIRRGSMRRGSGRSRSIRRTRTCTARWPRWRGRCACTPRRRTSRSRARRSIPGTARLERARAQPDAARPDRRRAGEPRDVVQGRPVRRPGEEHARSARHIQER